MPCVANQMALWVQIDKLAIGKLVGAPVDGEGYT
jgi:hypothetical protein